MAETRIPSAKATVSAPQSSASFETLPTELLLTIISHIPYPSSNLLNVHLTCRNFHTVLTHHEHHLARRIKHTQPALQEAARFFPVLNIPLTPNLDRKRPTTRPFAALNVLHTRSVALEDLHARWLHVTSHGPELSWLRGRWEGCHRAGLLLLYRLQDTGDAAAASTTTVDEVGHDAVREEEDRFERDRRRDSGVAEVGIEDTLEQAHVVKNGDVDETDDCGVSGTGFHDHRRQAASAQRKAALLHSLPAASLACILFKLVAGIKILRVYGLEPINARYEAGDTAARCEIELALEEMLLVHGPKFFVALLDEGSCGQKGWATRLLEAEVAGMDDRQMPDTDGLPRPPTLTSCLRRAFAAKLGCHFAENVTRMWDMLSSEKFDKMDEAMMIKIVHGQIL